jgi:hypothetical protein
MTRMETIKAKYDACEMTYEEALARLEALGMWASQADDYLAIPSHHHSTQGD